MKSDKQITIDYLATYRRVLDNKVKSLVKGTTVDKEFGKKMRADLLAVERTIGLVSGKDVKDIEYMPAGVEWLNRIMEGGTKQNLYVICGEPNTQSEIVRKLMELKFVPNMQVEEKSPSLDMGTNGMLAKLEAFSMEGFIYLQWSTDKGCFGTVKLQEFDVTEHGCRLRYLYTEGLDIGTCDKLHAEWTRLGHVISPNNPVL